MIGEESKEKDINGVGRPNSGKNILGKIGDKVGKGKGKDGKYDKKLDEKTYKASSYYNIKMVRENN